MPKTNAQRKANKKPGARRPALPRRPVVTGPCEVRFTFDNEADRDHFVSLIRPILRDHGYEVG